MTYLHNLVIDYCPLHQAWCETTFIKYSRKKCVQNITNTSTQACWSLFNCVINQRLLQASPHMQQTLSLLINLMNLTVTSYLRHM